MSKQLTEQETINKMQELNFEQADFFAWDSDSKKDNYAICRQFSPFESNFNSCLSGFKNLYREKYYIVKLSNGFEVRAWGMRFKD